MPCVSTTQPSSTHDQPYKTHHNCCSVHHDSKALLPTIADDNVSATALDICVYSISISNAAGQQQKLTHQVHDEMSAARMKSLSLHASAIKHDCRPSVV